MIANADAEASSGGLLQRISEALGVALQHSLPPEVEREARRALTNTLSTAVAGSRHLGCDALVEVGTRVGGMATVPVPGRRERLDPYWAAVATGFAAHVDDFDDTHLATVIHAGAATLAAAVGAAGLGAGGLAEAQESSRPDGPGDTLRVFALAIELQLRIGLGLGSSHYEAGWHSTGTCGVMGSAAMAGMVLGLSTVNLAGALGIAASSTLGHRESFGSDCKPFHPGKAAGNGLLASMVAANGVRSSDYALEGARGYFAVLSDDPELRHVLEGFGHDWRILDLTYKPYPCGIVAHPAIDAALSLSSAVANRKVRHIDVRCHPLVVDLMGNPRPSTGLESRFSAIHAVAASILDGRFGLEQVSDEAAQRRDIDAMRQLVSLQVDSRVQRAAGTLTVELETGEILTESVDAARGSRARPLTDAELEEKARALLGLRLTPGRVEDVIRALSAASEGDAISPLVALAVPEQTGEEGAAVDQPPRPKASYPTTSARDSAGLEITEQLCTFVERLKLEDIPEPTRHVGRRTIANALAVGILGARHPDVRAVSLGLRPLIGVGVATALDAGPHLSAPWAALINGMAIHVDDFDDTHLEAATHPGAAIVPAALAAAELVSASGADVLTGVIAGMEVALRVALGMAPEHFSRGWHVTGTVGHVGAAVAAARVLGLDGAALRAAVGLAATQAAGLQAAFGSATKAWHAGKAAADGLEAALLADAGLSGPQRPIEGRRGLVRTMSGSPDLSRIVRGLGKIWESESNSFKPYSCGLVSHPVIDAALTLRQRLNDDTALSGITGVVLGVNPVVLDVMGIRNPASGLEGKFSVYHCFAAAFLDGAGGPAQFLDSRVTAPDVRALRGLIDVEIDATLRKDAAWARVRLGDGTELSEHVVHALGSYSRPLTDSDIRAKAVLAVEPEIVPQVEELIELAFMIDELDSVSPLLSAAEGILVGALGRPSS